jgi:competence protein ComEA
MVGLLLFLIGAAAPDPFVAAVGQPLDTAFAHPGGGAATEGSRADTVEPAEIVIDVAGAVMHPGLHRLGQGDRVGDAIAAAGGFAPRVDLAGASVALNLAQPLEDGSKVLVPELGVDVIRQAVDDDGRIDLNKAGQSELESLPGVGPVTARNIIEARSEGRFASVREVRDRGIVGRSVFEDLKDLVRVSS